MELLIGLVVVVSLLLTVLLVRFLWMVPNDLRDIKKAIKYFVFLYDREEDDDID